MKSYRSYRSYSSSYRPYGSDDGYDARRDDKDGYLSAQLKLDAEYREHLRLVEKMKKEEKKS